MIYLDIFSILTEIVKGAVLHSYYHYSSDLCSLNNHEICVM